MKKDQKKHQKQWGKIQGQFQKSFSILRLIEIHELDQIKGIFNKYDQSQTISFQELYSFIDTNKNKRYVLLVGQDSENPEENHATINGLEDKSILTLQDEILVEQMRDQNLQCYAGQSSYQKTVLIQITSDSISSKITQTAQIIKKINTFEKNFQGIKHFKRIISMNSNKALIYIGLDGKNQVTLNLKLYSLLNINCKLIYIDKILVFKCASEKKFQDYCKQIKKQLDQWYSSEKRTIQSQYYNKGREMCKLIFYDEIDTVLAYKYLVSKAKINEITLLKQVEDTEDQQYVYIECQEKAKEIISELFRKQKDLQFTEIQNGPIRKQGKIALKFICKQTNIISLKDDPFFYNNDFHTYFLSKKIKLDSSRGPELINQLIKESGATLNSQIQHLANEQILEFGNSNEAMKFFEMAYPQFNRITICD